MIERVEPRQTPSRSAGLEARRSLGRYDTGRPGPLLVVIGGLHGNEPAGVRAARRVIEGLFGSAAPFAGRLVALAGNLGALRCGERFLARDLNRVWREEEVLALRGRDPSEDDAEGREQRELLAILEREQADWDGALVVLDLHTTSAGGAPFSLAADTLQNRALAQRLPLPMVLGLEEGIEGPLLSYLANRGVPAVVIEGGRHDLPETEDHLSASIWIWLSVVGALSADHPEVLAARRHLAGPTAGPPGLLELIHTHRIQPGDDFRMLPGFANFDSVDVGQSLAHDRRGVVRSPRRGLMLMPLYQEQGQDGYFLCREFSHAWLRFSERCRRSGWETLLPSLPGVRLEHGRPRCLRVEAGAPSVVHRVLRHFGYRKHLPTTDGTWLLARRPERDEV